jgi:hypothetical protein
MRIKIIGEVTEARLAEALQKALEQYQEARPGAKIYGANLYLRAFDESGEEFDLETAEGQPTKITLKPRKGTMVRPGRSAEVELKRLERKERRAEEKKAEEERWKEHNRQLHERLDRAEKKRDELNAGIQNANAITSLLVELMPERFCTEINACIKAAWEEINPVKPHGESKGKPVEMPYVVANGGCLMLTSPALKTPRLIKNPLWTKAAVGFQGEGKLETYWANPAWMLAVKKMSCCMDALMTELKGAIETIEDEDGSCAAAQKLSTLH